jgi:hypothetical protein
MEKALSTDRAFFLVDSLVVKPETSNVKLGIISAGKLHTVLKKEYHNYGKE